MHSGDFQLLHPETLLLLPLLAAVYLLARALSHDRDLSLNPFLHNETVIHPLLALFPSQRRKKTSRLLSHGVFWTFLLALSLAMAQPIKVGDRKDDEFEQRDIVFIIDTSLSMILKDYDYLGKRVSRIEILKHLLLKFVDELKDDRISLVVFGESAHTLAPYTQDKNFLRKTLARVDAGMVGRYNALGEGIALAAKANREAKSRKQILLLFTDAGLNTASIDPESAAYYAKELGFTLYAISIGSGSREAAEKSPYGGLLYQTVDLAYLDNLAKITGGKSYSAQNSKAIDGAISDILNVQTNPAILPPQYHQLQLYEIPLGIAVLILVLYSGIELVWRWRQ